MVGFLLQGGFKGTVIMVPLKVHEASSARDALGMWRRHSDQKIKTGKALLGLNILPLLNEKLILDNVAKTKTDGKNRTVFYIH